MSIPPGTRLGRYEIKAELGAAGMGEVYLAQDTTLSHSTVSHYRILQKLGERHPCC